MREQGPTDRISSPPFCFVFKDDEEKLKLAHCFNVITKKILNVFWKTFLKNYLSLVQKIVKKKLDESYRVKNIKIMLMVNTVFKLP